MLVDSKEGGSSQADLANYQIIGQNISALGHDWCSRVNATGRSSRLFLSIVFNSIDHFYIFILNFEIIIPEYYSSQSTSLVRLILGCCHK